jgi:prolyl-tRNA synthetase
MYQLKDSSDKDFGLGFTHEEVIVDLARGRIFSYRDLPLYLYQIQTKFRDEPRPRSGLIRGREFMMKDLYSFHADKRDLDEFYEICAKAYGKIFNRCGLKTIRTKASGGVFTKELTDEFQVLSDGGEDEIIYCPHEDFAENKEIARKKEGNKCPVCGEELQKSNAIEVGNIFKFGTVYAEKMNMYFTDEKGNKKPVYLGSYGVGITRTMAAIVEVSHDDAGIIWPGSIAPFQAQLIAISDKQEVISRAEEVYQKLTKAGVEVLYDDRKDISAGEKFADCDLIGIPARLVVSEKTGQKIEWKERRKKESLVLDLAQVLKRFSI